MEKAHPFVNWFRSSSPYIRAHRDKTFVIAFGGEAVLDPDFDHLAHDFALLSSLGIRLVLVHGIRPQIDQRLAKLAVQPVFHRHLRVTDELALQCVKEAAGTVRVEIEAILSMGLANTPMAGYGLKVVSGNFVIAKPIGVIDGVDYRYTGAVRRINGAALKAQLEHKNIVVISPIGYSPTGEVFNLSAEQVATAVASELKAEKLILLTERRCCDAQGDEAILQMTVAEAETLLADSPDLDNGIRLSLTAAIQGCKSGVARAHLLERTTDGALLLELFTHNGVGTLVSAVPFEELRQAELGDIGGILELIKPLEQQGILARRSRERIEMDIADYTVLDRDGLIIGCAALHADTAGGFGAVACLAVHPDYRNGARGNRLLATLCKKAQGLRLATLYALSTQTAHWFIERGFAVSDPNGLPEAIKKLYNPRRNSKILYKTIV